MYAAALQSTVRRKRPAVTAVTKVRDGRSLKGEHCSLDEKVLGREGRALRQREAGGGGASGGGQRGGSVVREPHRGWAGR